MDDELMSTDQQTLVARIVDAVNTAARPVTPDELARHLGAEPEDVSAVLRILELPAVQFQRGESPPVVLARILDVLESIAAGEEYEPPPSDADDRY